MSLLYPCTIYCSAKIIQPSQAVLRMAWIGLFWPVLACIVWPDLSLCSYSKKPDRTFWFARQNNCYCWWWSRSSAACATRTWRWYEHSLRQKNWTVVKRHTSWSGLLYLERMSNLKGVAGGLLILVFFCRLMILKTRTNVCKCSLEWINSLDLTIHLSVMAWGNKVLTKSVY